MKHIMPELEQSEAAGKKGRKKCFAFRVGHVTLVIGNNCVYYLFLLTVSWCAHLPSKMIEIGLDLVEMGI